MADRIVKTAAVILIATALIAVAASSLQATDFKNGITVYAEYCEQCHGPSGNGMGGMGGMGELRSYVKLMRTDEELFTSIRDGNMAMPGFDGVLTTDEILDVIAYMRTFR